MCLILHLVCYIFLLGLLKKEVNGDDSSSSTALQVVPSGNLGQCCAEQKQNLVELRTLLIIFLELLGGCDEDSNKIENTTPSSITPAPISASVGIAPESQGSCSALSDKPKDCLNDLNCEYDCLNKKCEAFKSLEFKKGECKGFCYNPCQCRKAGCAYDSSKGECNDIEKVCKNLEFFPNSCRRSQKKPTYERLCPKIYYAYKGALCLNKNDKNKDADLPKGTFGKCEIEETIIAINLGMKDFHMKALGQFGFGAKELTPDVEDQDELKYKYDHDTEFEDPFGVVKGDMTSSENGMSLTAACKCPKLYGSQIWGDFEKKGGEGKQKGWRGPTYKIPLTKDGMYELMVKAIDNQPNYKPGDRWFNVFFNKIWLLPEIDILETTKNKYGVDWIVNFMVSDGGKKLKMKGYDDSDIVGGVVPISFYFGMCATKDEDFHVAAFAVNKFK